MAILAMANGHGLTITKMAKQMMAIVKMAKRKHGPQILATCTILVMAMAILAMAI